MFSCGKGLTIHWHDQLTCRTVGFLIAFLIKLNQRVVLAVFWTKSCCYERMQPCVCTAVEQGTSPEAPANLNYMVALFWKCTKPYAFVGVACFLLSWVFWQCVSFGTFPVCEVTSSQIPPCLLLPSAGPWSQMLMFDHSGLGNYCLVMGVLAPVLALIDFAMWNKMQGLAHQASVWHTRAWLYTWIKASEVCLGGAISSSVLVGCQYLALPLPCPH